MTPVLWLVSERKPMRAYERKVWTCRYAVVAGSAQGAIELVMNACGEGADKSEWSANAVSCHYLEIGFQSDIPTQADRDARDRRAARAGRP